MKKLLLVGSHVAALLAGFALGIYALPILTAPEPPSATELAMLANGAAYRGEFRRDLKDSDALHWGEGTVSVGVKAVAFVGQLAPGPDYKLYLSPEFVETEVDFERLKASMARVGDVKTFTNFVVPVRLSFGASPSASSSRRPSTASSRRLVRSPKHLPPEHEDETRCAGPVPR